MAIRDMMNNYFYGKQGKADMTVADLPANRRQLFAEVFSGTYASTRIYSIIVITILLRALFAIFSSPAPRAIPLVPRRAYTVRIHAASARTDLMIKSITEPLSYILKIIADAFVTHAKKNMTQNIIDLIKYLLYSLSL